MVAKQKERVFIGLSGGVDSSVAALLLREQGYDVTGVFIKTWQPDFIECNWEKERLDAMCVAAHLRIPFLTCDATQSYKKEVVDYMLREYKEGRTPNPDVMCNKFVKFGAFLNFAKSRGVQKIATGHYAQIVTGSEGYLLKRGADKDKDQSYFLWALTQTELSQTIFPLGTYTKGEVRKMAKKAMLPTYAKKDSQGICMLGDVSMREFLEHYIAPAPGKILNEAGTVVGMHDGAFYFTLGQRHGFTPMGNENDSSPQYVTDKDLSTNTVTISTTPPKIQEESILLHNLNLISSSIPKHCVAQCRYRQTPFAVSFQKVKESVGRVEMRDASIDKPSPGQSCVLYEGEICRGGGIIENTI